MRCNVIECFANETPYRHIRHIGVQVYLTTGIILGNTLTAKSNT